MALIVSSCLVDRLAECEKTQPAIQQQQHTVQQPKFFSTAILGSEAMAATHQPLSMNENGTATAMQSVLGLVSTAYVTGTRRRSNGHSGVLFADGDSLGLD